jgi:hypothetical protein
VRPQVHIYPMSRLVHAPATEWMSKIRSIEEGKEYAYSYYLPMREAIVSFCQKKGKGRAAIVQTMLRRAAHGAGPRQVAAVNDNASAFGIFETSFYPKIKKFDRSFLKEKQAGVEFEGITLIGGPHFLATDRDNRERYVFLHAALWDQENLRTYLQLLSIVVEERFNSSGESIWCMNLRSGRDEKWRPGTRIRSRCSKAAQLFARLVKAMGA